MVKPNIPSPERRKAVAAHGARPGEKVTIDCAYCGSSGFVEWPLNLSGKPSGWPMISGLEIDHIEPIANGGANVAENMTLACQPCNRRKGHKTLEEWRATHGR